MPPTRLSQQSRIDLLVRGAARDEQGVCVGIRIQMHRFGRDAQRAACCALDSCYRWCSYVQILVAPTVIKLAASQSVSCLLK